MANSLSATIYSSKPYVYPGKTVMVIVIIVIPCLLVAGDAELHDMQVCMSLKLPGSNVQYLCILPISRVVCVIPL